MKCAALFSGGKDSTRAIYLAQKAGHDVVVLLTVFSQNEESYMFHTCNIELSKLQAQAMKLPQLVAETEGKKEEELEDLEKLIAEAKNKFGIEGVVCGGLASVYQGSRIEKICKGLKLEMLAPLWCIPAEEHLKGLLREGFKVIFTGVFADGLGKEWLGRELDEKAVQELLELEKKKGVSPVGEGGEFESAVLDCPLFKGKIKIVESEPKWEGLSGKLLIKKTYLISKP
ncbi:MAG: diphthine--ammonia ligase [Candidatus Aenigmarchaeota archaeon]|nr:diphthine--ammonia ligase [Candidatus Aenigmarchaeota archaeon]